MFTDPFVPVDNMMLCPDCEGSGAMEEMEADMECGGLHFGTGKIIECNTCNGEGWIPR